MQINNKREISFTRVTLTLTILALVVVFAMLGHDMWSAAMQGQGRVFAESLLLSVAISLLSYGVIQYQICLIGNYTRMEDFVPAPRTELDRMYEGSAPALSIIIPSYKEERMVNWQTMMSAALSEYPSKNVVLLIDDPYTPKVLEDIIKIEDTRKIPGEMQRQFDAQAERFRAEQRAFQQRQTTDALRTEFERAHLAVQYDAVAAWLDQVVLDSTDGQPLETLPHAVRFFTREILQAPAAKHRALAEELRGNDAPLSEDYLALHYARLVGLFTVHFSSFERKKYANLSHEANKAMNLNSYIDLIGRSWREVAMADGLHLVESTPNQADFSIPHADYINTIDSDTLMLGEYSLRIIHLMEQEENKRIAVCQSPCSTIPGAPGLIERLGGAMIDVQFRSHQGYTHWGASFWVGANAMLRHEAMLDIKETNIEKGYPVPVYIQDRTVIEDTESSIDLIDKGWKLHNYLDRMTFSSMPPDFGSLLIQRRRWSNGGLIILPKLVRYAIRAKKNKALAKELFMRVNYLSGTTTSVFTALLLLLYPFSKEVGTPLISLAFLPMIVLFVRDMRNTGYGFSDALQCLGFNMILLPIATGGVLKQFQQMITGNKIPFGRTPKVSGRTAAPALYCLLELAMLAIFMLSVVSSAMSAEWTKFAVSAANAALFAVCLYRFLGVKAMLQDMTAPVRSRLRLRTHQAQIFQLPSAAPVSPLPVAMVVRSKTA